MTVEEIRELIRLAKETGVAQLEVQRGEDRVCIRVGGLGLAPAGEWIAVQPTANALPQTAAPAAAPAPAAASAARALEESQPAPDNLSYVRSPIVGTFYESPSPGAPPFVRIGEKVQPGKVLCIIESMKLMNEIEAEFAGAVEQKLVANGQPVEYGEALFAIRPV